MDNLAHALTGALIARTLPDHWAGEVNAESRLDPDVRRPGVWLTWSAVIAANLPDFEALVLWPPPLGDKAAYLLHHRGWSHSLVGIAAEAAAFTALLWLLARWRRTAYWFAGFTLRRGLAVAALGVGSHLFMDWWNSYGVRPFYPWDKSWYYGDLVFIVDPWVWLTLGGALVCGTRRFGRTKWGWYALTAAATVVVVEACRRGVTPWWVAAAWGTGVIEIALLRWWGRWRAANSLGWSGVATYLLFAGWVTWQAPRDLTPERLDWSDRTVAVMPVAGVPWTRQVIAVAEGEAARELTVKAVGGPVETVYQYSVGPWKLAFLLPKELAPGNAFIRWRPSRMPVPNYLTDDQRVRAWRSFARAPVTMWAWEAGGGAFSARTLELGDLRYQMRLDEDDWSRMEVPILPADTLHYDPAVSDTPPFKIDSAP